jgi:Cu-Zn family superoxide dismutase
MSASARFSAWVTVVVLATAGCTSLTPTPTDNTATAEVRTAAGAVVGIATFTEVSGGVRMVLEAKGLTPGAHGLHLHDIGTCEPPSFEAAGAHVNPDGKSHGLLNSSGPHAGDLPNLTVGADGSGRFETMNTRITLAAGPSSILDADGSALVIHANPDDFTTDPAGGTGARIACGVVTKAPDGPARPPKSSGPPTATPPTR